MTGARSSLRTRKRRGLPHTKTVRVRGRAYVYFVTTGPDGKPIRSRLPALDDPQFGASYAAHLAAMTRRANAKAILTVPALIDLYQRSPKFDRLADGSRRAYGVYLRQFAEEFPTAPAGKIERRDVVRIVDKRAKTPGAANMLLRTIGALYAWARNRGHVANEPTRDIDALDIGEHQPWPQALVDAALASSVDRVRLAVHLLLYTAQRIGDVCRMRWADIEAGTIHVRQQKTGRELVIPLHAKLVAELARHPKSLGTILPGPTSPQTLRHALKAFAAKRGHQVVPHGLRKNAVNALLESGCSVAETAAISGQSLQMVEFYAKGRAQKALGSAAILKWERRKRT